MLRVAEGRRDVEHGVVSESAGRGDDVVRGAADVDGACDGKRERPLHIGWHVDGEDVGCICAGECVGDACEPVAVLCGECDVAQREVGDSLRKGNVNREAADVCVDVVCDVCVYHKF